MPGYNQHLAGMQQLAQIYAKSVDQERRYAQYILTVNNYFYVFTESSK